MEAAWSELYERTLAVIRSYGPVVAYYLRAYMQPAGEQLTEAVVQLWQPVDVLKQIESQRSSLITAGAKTDLFSYSKRLSKWVEEEPQSDAHRVEFLTVAKSFVALLPMEDPFPLNFEDEPDDDEQRWRKYSGVVYRAQRRMDMPLRWFHIYAKAFKTVAKAEPNYLSPRRAASTQQPRIRQIAPEDMFKRHGVKKRRRDETNHVIEESQIDWRDTGTQIPWSEEDTAPEPLTEILTDSSSTL